MAPSIIDLTQALNEAMPVYPGTPSPEFKVVSTVLSDGYRETRLDMLSHTGTHIDAPSHILEGGRTLDRFPVEKFTGPGVVIPCHEIPEITLEFLRPYESLIAAAEFVLFHTGWQDRWGTPSYFENCPIPARNAAEWLSGFPLKGIGIDSFSTDLIGSPEGVNEAGVPNHFIFLRKGILLIENLTNLDQLPRSGFIFQCFPLKVEGIEGSPVRAVAMVL